MRKVLVIGSGGAGKSTFARRLGQVTGLEVIHLDSVYWHPGCVETPKDVWRETVGELLRRDSWIIDGNYSGTLAQRVAACDTVIFLDTPRAVCLWRVLKRWVLHRNGGRPDMGEGCREKLNFEFIRWVWGYPTRTRPKVTNMLAEHSRGKRVVRLRSQSEVEEFLARAGRVMNGARINFAELPWDESSDGARSKSFVGGGRKLRLVEFTDEFAEHDWCLKAHAGYVLEGELEIRFADRTEKFAAGDGILIAGGEGGRHRAKVVGKAVRLILVEDV